MQKIMFNDKYGLTQAVLEGSKTMTRRIIDNKTSSGANDYVQRIHGTGLDFLDYLLEHSRYNVGEVVAVAQRYCDIKEYNPEDYEDVMLSDGAICEASHPYAHLMREPGWTNKMFVRADLMPNRIRITNVRVERLQDISNEDCMKEGIMEGEFMNTWDTFYYDEWGDVPNHITFKSPREAFAALIDKVSGKGTWDSNPWVYVYEFEKVK